MKTTPVTTADLTRSVLAVPPLARNDDLTINRAANRRLIDHLEGGGVRTLMYGGNANFYNIGLYEYADLLDFLAEAAGADTWVIPSVGPDYGKLIDQARVLRTRAFPTAMVLPLTFPATSDGAENGIRRFADALGKQVIVYVKAENFLTPEAVGRLVDSGIVAAIKYAVVRSDPKVDAFLGRLVKLVDRKLIVSGIGERPAIVHLRDWGLTAFTSGSVCVAPRGSMALLAALQAGDYPAAERLRAAYLPLEDQRDTLSPIRVLHEAVSLAGIAPMGPMLPQLSNLEREHHATLARIAADLLAHDRALRPSTVAA
jgi:dihydrodipicolinate synthase/N-acetylneuraminate lyase